ncbi:zinc-binding dehydrogenase [Streptomyces albipurpureus]|uniref:2-deoxy-scyllo-inosamine dehydrogenase n=1 Tax=Streptomyces albipurpureus TaxID=2897419 RepID=A0ABT0UHF5_9ACTN|nr:alcohol dehydrogenase catalytic domain-containing protein [Streptomyces sp. CWNU-1]MCM2387606.1 alcohol dehydrogenase catalytic domain-containing protein [Streptomyces sp. CWNU-1]
MTDHRMMSAVVTHGPRDYRVEQVPVPTPGRDEVLIRTGAVGICGSDIKCYTGASLFWGENGDDGYVEGPVITGHEFAGVVEALGPGAGEKHGISIGDQVVAEQILPCQRCRFCREGAYWMCEPNEIFGFKRGRAEGGMAEFTLFPANAIVHRVDPRLSAVEAAYLEPLACAIHAVDRAEIKPGDTVVIAGIGSIGLCMLQWARQYNPRMVIAVGTRPLRLELAEQLGADVAINVRESDVVAQVRALTDGYGADVVVEASGAADGPQQALEMVRKMGTVVAFSSIKDPVRVNWNLAGDQKELTIRGSHLGPYCYPKAIEAVAEGRVDVASLVTGQYAIDEFEAAIEAAMSGDGIKTMVLPGLSRASSPQAAPVAEGQG